MCSAQEYTLLASPLCATAGSSNVKTPNNVNSAQGLKSNKIDELLSPASATCTSFDPQHHSTPLPKTSTPVIRKKGKTRNIASEFQQCNNDQSHHESTLEQDKINMAQTFSKENLNPRSDGSVQKEPKVKRQDSTQAKLKFGIQVKAHNIVDVQFENVCSKEIPFIFHDNCVYIGCKESFELMHYRNQIIRQGYVKVDYILEQAKLNPSNSFLCEGRSRLWIKKQALLALLNHKSFQSKKNIVLKSVLQNRKRFRCMNANDKTTEKAQDKQSDIQSSGPNIHVTSTKHSTNEAANATFKSTVFNQGKISVEGMDVGFITEEEALCLATTPIFSVLGLAEHKTKRGFKFIDTYLANQGLDPKSCFIMNGKKRPYMKLNAIQALIVGVPVKMMDETKKTYFSSVLLKAVQNQMLKQYTGKQVIKDRDTSRSGNPIIDCINHDRSCSKEVLLDSLSDMIGSNKKTQVSELKLTTDDLISVLHTASERSVKAAKIVKGCVTSLYKILNPTTPETLINVRENTSGTRLMDQMRKIVPGILPSRAKEQEALWEMSRQFLAILQPKRCSTGWYIEPTRLMAVLLYKYQFFEGKIYVKVQGDAAKIGDRHTTYIGISLLNHELILRDISYQNPKEIYSIALFYESDSRDNLEENLAKCNFMERLLSSSTEMVFYLGGDEMFLQKMLDGSDVLGPLKEKGWNIYHECPKESKKEVANNGLRTDLEIPMNRLHPESLLPSMPLQHIVPCILHWVARCTEKLVTLVVEDIFSTANKSAQVSGSTSADDLIRNLEANINTRGVKQGNFRILLDKDGKPEQISLNKDDALTIISPAPHQKELDYPHVLKNVVPDALMKTELPGQIKNYFNITQVTEFQCVFMIWESLYNMFTILQKEPKFHLLHESLQGSLKPSDYNWGYSSEQIETYKYHAERFYQLVCLRYKWKNITPYMMKFIDYGVTFMTNLKLPICRFSTEGGEHSNYLRNCFFYQHTTRHGGRKSFDALFAQFSTTWRRLYYEILHGEDTLASSKFQIYVKRHVAAYKIQRIIRLFLVKCKLKKTGYVENPSCDTEKLTNLTCISKLATDVCNQTISSTVKPAMLFSGKAFVVSGNVPKYDGVKMSQDTCVQLIERHGGKVRKCLPGACKGRSTKKYILLTNTGNSKKDKIPAIIKNALRRRYHVVNYSFLFDSIAKDEIQLVSNYVPANIDAVKTRLSLDPTLHQRHFQKKKHMVTILKGKRKCKPHKQQSVKVAKNAAVFYGMLKRTEHKNSHKKSVSFRESAKLLGHYTQEFTKLPKQIKDTYIKMWVNKKNEQLLKLKQMSAIKAYNNMHRVTINHQQ